MAEHNLGQYPPSEEKIKTLEEKLKEQKEDNSSISKKIDKSEASIVEAIGYFASGFIKMSLAPYVIPTVIRKCINDKDYSRDKNNKEEDLENCKGLGILVGFWPGFYVQTFCYGLLIKYGTLIGPPWPDTPEKNPELLLIPLATNALSLAYEGGRALYNKTKNSKSTSLKT